MKVLMLGNSLTYCNDMPRMVATLLNEEVDSVTRGGAYLHQMLDPVDELCVQINEALNREKWDYVVIQEQSSTPALQPEIFQFSARKMCEKIRAISAKPVLYAHWAYEEDTPKLATTGMTYTEMDEALYTQFHIVAEKNGMLVADVGKAFTAMRTLLRPYAEDHYHPSQAGSLLAAHVIAKVIEEDWNK